MATFVCPYCGISKEMSASRAKLNRTCGTDTCRARYLAERGHGNKGKRHSAEVNRSKGNWIRGKVQTPEHIAARTQARLDAGWFQIDDIGARIRAGHQRVGYKPDTAGAKNPQWRGGPTARPESRDRTTRAYWHWRHMVCARDEWRCQHCGALENIVAHHIEEWDDAPERRLDVTNGVTLCRKCHAVAHGFNKRLSNKMSDD